MATEEDQILERIEQIGDLIDGGAYCECVKEHNPNNVFIRVMLDVELTSKNANAIFYEGSGDGGIACDILDGAKRTVQEIWPSAHVTVNWNDYVVRIGHQHGCKPDEQLRREK